MTTGIDLSRYFDQKIDKAYSNYLDNAKKNRLIRDAFYRVIERKIEGEDTQKEYDELSELTITEKEYTLNNGRIYLAPLQISNVAIVGTTATVTTRKSNNLVNGDTVTISGVQGFTTSPNGTFVVSSVTDTTFQATVTATGGAYTANTGKVVYNKMIADYYRMRALKCKFSKRLGLVSEATNANPLVVTLDTRTNLRNGEQVTISSGTGNLAVNGTFYVKRYTDKKFALYTDKDLLSPVAGTGVYQGGGVAYKIVYESGRFIDSSEKMSVYAKNDIQFPRYEFADKLLKIRPDSCEAITADYFRVFPEDIDVTNTVTDFEMYYPARLLYYLIDEAAKIFDQSSRDGEQYQIMSKEVVENP